MTASSKGRYARFIPKEELGAVTRWHFGEVGGSGTLLLEPLQVEPALPVASEEDIAARAAEAAQLQAQQAQALQQAADEAYGHGLAQGQEQAMVEWQRRMDDYVAEQGKDMAQRLDAVVQALGSSLDAMQQHMAQDVLELACAIARQVVRQELRTNTATLQPVVAEALGMLVADGRPTTVRLHPADLEQVGAALRAELSSPQLQWLADAEVPLGGCQVEAAGTVVDGSLQKRWQRAIAPLGLASAWEVAGDAEPQSEVQVAHSAAPTGDSDDSQP